MLPALPSATATRSHHSHTRASHLDNNNSGTGSRSANSGSNAKRSSGMIFRIEHLIPTSGSSADVSSAPSKTTHANAGPVGGQPADERGGGGERPSKRARIQRAGVCVSQFVPKDTASELISTHTLLAETPSSSATMTLHQQLTYSTLSQGVLCMTPAILRRIKLSEDIPSYNALFELHNGHVRLRTVRDMERDDEIVAWFGEETTLLMGIPFLTPLNIQGNNRYTCHLCSLTFETPNPLKIHLALGCGRHSMDILWVRLHYGVCASACTRHLLPVSGALGMPTMTISPSASSPLLRSSPNQPTLLRSSQSPGSGSPTSLTPTRTSSHFSAFKPIAERLGANIGTTMASSSGSLTSSSPPRISAAGYHHTYTHSHPVASIPGLAGHTNTLAFSAAAFLPTLSSVGSTLSGDPSMSLHHSLPSTGNNPLNAAAQIEAIVSNMGASKQGHLCIYCGKVYSRKYGLKIHIRTHTGFKPLKCKFCLRPFGDPSNLNKHVRLHLQTTPTTGGSGGDGSGSGNSLDGFKCHLCNKTLARRRDLQRHIESRHTDCDGPLVDVESK